MAEPTPDRVPTFEGVFRSAFTERIREEIVQDGSIQVEEAEDFIDALVNWHLVQSIIEAEKTLLQTNKATIEEIEAHRTRKEVTANDLEILEGTKQSILDQEYQIRSYEAQVDMYSDALKKSIGAISLGNTDLEDKLWALSDHLSAFAKDIYKHTK